MKNEQAIKDMLIANTISIIAEGGFEKATTKAITHYKVPQDGIRMNEVYIYRLFDSKENLYTQAFSTLDAEFFSALEYRLHSAEELSINTTEKLHRIFSLVWPFLMHNEIRCRCYVRYYYSIYFRGKSRASHNARFSKIVEIFTPLFKDEADVCAIMRSVLGALLDFAIRVYNGDLEDTEINRAHIFNVLYLIMVTYFRDEIPKTNPLSITFSTQH